MEDVVLVFGVSIIPFALFMRVDLLLFRQQCWLLKYINYHTLGRMYSYWTGRS